jgi:hypothetical protein
LTFFGFNTDVSFGSDTYHVQTELRSGEHAIETQVFVRGRSVGKRNSSYSDSAAGDVQQLLRMQHKNVVEEVRAGKLPGSGHELSIECLNEEDVLARTVQVLSVRVCQAKQPVDGALVTLRFGFGSDNPIYSQGVSDEQGNAELAIDPEQHNTTVSVRARHGDSLAVRHLHLP